MAQFHQVGEPVNDGERHALRVLRDDLPDSWEVIGNFTVLQAGRPFECDALAVGPDGWAYLIEVKAWAGQITGNDAQWQLPPLVGDSPSFRSNPAQLTTQKARVVATVLKEDTPELSRVFVQPLVTLDSDTPPDLDGDCAKHTVLVDQLVDRVQTDPRPSGYRRGRVPDDLARRTSEALVRSSRPIAPSDVVGAWRLLEEIQIGPFWEVFSAVPAFGGDQARPMRLKRYRIDSLLTGERRRAQRDRARRDLDALERLAAADGAVPPVSAVEDVDGSFVVVTEWPDGESLASLLSGRGLAADDAEDVFESLADAVASIHREGVIHRNLTPECAHLLRDGRVVLTDLDYARLPAREGDITRHLGDELQAVYLAPEVRDDPATASKASDVWSTAKIGLALFGAPPGASDAEAVPPAWHPAFERALKADPDERQPDAEGLANELFGEHDPQLALFEGFEPNDVLDDRWVIRGAAIEGGGIARVYQVHDTMTQEDYAAKFVREEYSDQFDAAEEYKLLFDVPDHPGIVKPEFPQNLRRYRRADRQYSKRGTFLLTRWVEGTRLDLLIKDKPPPVRCIELGLDLADAVEHLHKRGLLHRDLKPQNVIVDGQTGRPRIVDFNVSRAVDVADHTQTGTPPYRPPDHADTGWGTHCDTYALGVIVCELLAGKLLREPTQKEWLEQDTTLPAGLRDVLQRATHDRKEGRYDRAELLAEDLRGALEELLVPPALDDEAPFPSATEEELRRPNWNPYQNRLVRLFSQSRTTNAGTRGLDDFARWAYVQTLVDSELFSDIAGGRFGLVVITGNAGDGKTAFVQMLESRLRDSGGEFRPRLDGNGGTLERHGHRFETNWDGSQDEGDKANDDVLVDFFRPFRGEGPEPGEGETRVIAINEGRLLDFVDERRQEFPWLSRMVTRYFTEEQPPAEQWCSIVNLNLRALTIPGDDGRSLTGRLLDRFADARLWEPCAGCSAYEHCYARANAAALRDPVLGDRASERIRQTLDLVRLRRRLHVTMRDLRSALAFIVAGNRTCDEIVALVDNVDRDALIGGHLYNALFAASDKLGPPARSQAATQDRLLGVVGTLDVAKTADPEDDARLWTLGPDALRPDPPALERSDRALLEDLRQSLPQASSHFGDRRVRSDLRLLQASLRRKLFLEREEPRWIAMLPYERLDSFMRQLDGCTDEDRDSIARAISQSEGLFAERFNDRLAVRLTSGGDGPQRSLVLHDASGFELAPLDRSSAARYVEYAPDILRLSSVSNPDLRLDIDLDLFETLTRILEGFTPSREELRGAWLNLRIFKEHLASVRSQELLLTGDGRTYYNVQADPDALRVRAERAA